MSGAMTPASSAPMPPPDPTAGAAPDSDAGSDITMVVSIGKKSDGSYVVFAGDEPDDDSGGDMSEDDDDAMGDAGSAGGGPGAASGDPMGSGGGGSGNGGQPAASIGAALKIAMDIMQSDKSSGAPSDDDQFAAGFGASKAPTPIGMGGGA